MLIVAGDKASHNMMTASWGGLGVLWEKNVVTVYVRPTRYTYEFMERENNFSLCFFGKDKDVHKIGGYKSGRDIDKANAAGLTPVYDYGTVYYKEAELVLICKKLYTSVFDNTKFISPDIEKYYPQKDYHSMYIGEISKVLRKS